MALTRRPRWTCRGRRCPPRWPTSCVPGLPGVVEDIIAAVRAEVVEYDQPLEGEFGRLIREGAAAALGQFVDLLGRDVDLPDVGVYEAIGPRRVPRRPHARRAAVGVSRRRARGVAGGRGAAPRRRSTRASVPFAEAIFAYIDRLADAVGVRLRARAVAAGGVRCRRGATRWWSCCCAATRATRPRSSAPPSRPGWPLPAQLAVVALGDGDPLRVVHRMPVGTIGATLEPGGVLVVPDPDGPGRRRQLARRACARQPGVLGPTVPWARAHESARRALTGVAAARRRPAGGDTLARADEHLLDLALVADDAPGARLRRRAGSRRCEAMKPAARERAAETLRAWLDAHGDVTVDRTRAARPPAVGPLPARPPARGVRRRARRPARRAGDRRRR